MSSKKAPLLSGLFNGLCVLGVSLGLMAQSGCQTWKAGMTLPSSRYVQHPPQDIPPSPPFPLTKELAAREKAAIETHGVKEPAIEAVRQKPVAVKPDGLEEFVLKTEKATFNNFLLVEQPVGAPEAGDLPRLKLKGCYRNRTAQPLHYALVVVGLDQDGDPLWACTLSGKALARDIGCLQEANIPVPAGTLGRTTSIRFSANLDSPPPCPPPLPPLPAAGSARSAEGKSCISSIPSGQ